MYGNPEDETTRRDGAHFLKAFTDEIREAVERRCRELHYHYTRQKEPSDEEFQKIVDDAVENELFACGRKLAKLLTEGID